MPKVVPQYTDDAKRRIIQAAMEVMAEKGYENVIIDDVAKRIGVTKGAVYWYFRNKNALIQEVLITIENELEKIASDPFFNRSDHFVLPYAVDRIFFDEETRIELLTEIGLPITPGDMILSPSPDSVQELISVLEKGIEWELHNGNIQTQPVVKTLALALAIICSGLQKGEIYVMLFLGHTKVRVVWFHAMKCFLHSEIP